MSATRQQLGVARRPGFTIAEMGVSAAVTALLMVSIGAAMVIASRSLPSAGSQPNVTMTATSALSDLGDDLACALRVTECTSTSITFTVADRGNDADSNPEKIRYAWSGVVGDPLTRSYNGGTAVTVVPSVRSLSFTYQTRTSTESYEAKSVETSEFVLKSSDTTSNITEVSVGGSDASQYFLPSLPAGAKSYSVTRALYQLTPDGSSDGSFLAQLRQAMADMTPSTTVLAQEARSESALSGSVSWYQSDFTGNTNLVGFAPTKGLCLVLSNTGGGNACKWEQRGSGSTLAGAAVSTGGSSWGTPNTTKAFQFYVYGKAFALPSGSTNLTATRTYLTGVQVSVNPGGAADNPLYVSFAVGNEPEQVEVAWDTELSADPTAIDTDGDGLPDWKLRSDNSLTASAFSGGLWTATGTGALDSNSTTPPTFGALTTVTAKFRDKTTGDGGVSVRLNAVRSGGLIAPVIATLTLQSDNTQTLTLQVCNSAGSMVTVYTCPNLSSTATTVRLMADAAQRTVNLRVNDSELGTFAIDRRIAGMTAADTAGVSVSIDNGGTGELDSISVHAGRS